MTMNDCTSIRERYFVSGAPPQGVPELDEHLASCASCRSAASALTVVDRALADVPALPVAPPPFAAIARAAGKAAAAQRRRQSARRWLPYLATGFAAAAAAALLAFVAAPRLPRVPVLAVGERIESTSTSGARQAVLESGAEVRLESGLVERIPSPRDEERLFLGGGSVSLQVPKLKGGRTVAVCTPDAEVRVHGTRFQVIRDAQGTSVSVAEGLVEVKPYGGGRSPVFVKAGQSTKVESPVAYRQALRDAAQASLDQGDFAAAQQRLSALLATELDLVERAEAYALLAWSLSGSGNRAAAVEQYRHALEMLPEAERPLWADNAAAELALLLEQVDPAQAPRAWRDYLRRFPSGVHAAQAGSRAASE
ncbi:MAG TPA: FecR domain-containing protein [Myxococcales bacterium]|jgi:ferric-dicitrate binding protein FerR (iron transport regulator)